MKAKYSFLKIIMVIAMVFAALPITGQQAFAVSDSLTHARGASIIREARVSGLREPFVGETAVDSSLMAAHYDSHCEILNVLWYTSESAEYLMGPVRFEAGKSYYAKIILHSLPGYIFETDPHQFDVITLNNSTAWIDLSKSGIYYDNQQYFCISTINFVPKEPTVIKDVRVTGFVEPVAGQIAITSNDLSSPDGAPYTPFMLWKNPESGATLPEPMIFETGKQYYAEVVLGAHYGYVFEADPHQFDVFTLNGSTAWIDFSRSGPGHEDLKSYTMATIRFVSNSSVVTFNANGGNVIPSSAMTDVNGKLTSLPTPSREGYSFTGWYSAPSGGSAISLDRVYTEDTTIYAHWVRNTYTITFDPNGGTVTPTSATTNSEGRLDSLPTPTREGYTFLNWCSEPVGGHSIGTSKIYTADTTIYAHWVKKSYTVSFDSHSGSAVPSQIVEHGDKATRPADPTRGGFTFDDWYADAAYTTKFDFNTPITGPRTIYAKWIPYLLSFTVDFNVDGGSTIPSQTVIEGGKVTQPEDPTKEGFVFAGWFANSRKTISFDFETTEIYADTTIYAKWVNPATIWYHVSFMKGTTHILSQQRIYSGDYVERPTAAEVERMEHLAGDGSVLEDWYTDTTYTTKFDFDQPITSDTRIYGKWLEGYTVTFYGHSNNVYKNVEAGKTVSPPENPPVWEGHTILGWYTEWSCINAFDFSTPITENITLYPKWIDNTPTVYTVSFNANGGSGTMTPVTVNIGDKLTLPECGFVPQEGKEFDRWDAGNPGEQVEIVSDCTITAIWREKAVTYAVTFDANGHGTAPAAQTVNSGETATEPAAPTEIGWTFGGWYTEAACTNAFDFSTPITADITLYAKWTEESVTPVTHTVTFDGNGHGTPPAPVTVEHGNPVGCPADPVADPGWKFAGWCEDKEGTTAYQFSTPVTSDITIYASWTEEGGTPTTYTVSFNANSGSGTMLDIIVNGGEKLTLPECGFTPPTEDKEFDKWDAGNPGEQVDIISDCMITAIWRDKIAIYTVTVTNDSNGTASALPTSGPTGTNVVLTATPNGGYQFKEWQIVSGGVTITDNNFTIGTGNVEIKAIFEEATAEIMYAFTKGDGTSWTKSSGVALDFTVKGSPDDTNTFANFTGIQIDGATIASGNYTALAGSVDITLKPAFLETLSTSSHIIKAQFKDGDAEAMFTITETEPPVTVPPTAVPPVTAPPITPPPSDPGYDFKFTFTKAWQGDHEGSIDWVLYHPDGTVAHKKFNKKIISENEWRYEAWFPTATDYYIVETVPEGYKVRYENIGAHAGETDRCYNGGTIINYKIPKTGDTAPFLLWLSCIGLGLAAVSSGIFIGKRRKTRR